MELRALIREALAEDLSGNRDLTSDLFVSPVAHGDGWIEAREPIVLSGIEACAAVFEEVDHTLQVEILRQNGETIRPLEQVLRVSGRAQSILRAERTALNFLSHLSGIATRTREFAEATRQWKTEILCTRKTLPGLRELQFAAVRHGGGQAYRANLADALLIKDNHLSISGGLPAIRTKLEELKRHDMNSYETMLANGKIEVTSLDALTEAVTMGWLHILLDNFAPAQVAEAVERFGKKVYLEMSGGVNRANLEEYARTGVHAISIGALTHSVRAADFSLECDWRRT